jgi:hypothetical protein
MEANRQIDRQTEEGVIIEKREIEKCKTMMMMMMLTEQTT